MGKRKKRRHKLPVPPPPVPQDTSTPGETYARVVLGYEATNPGLPME